VGTLEDYISLLFSPHWMPILWLDGSHFTKYLTILLGKQRRLGVAKHAYLEHHFMFTASQAQFWR